MKLEQEQTLLTIFLLLATKHVYPALASWVTSKNLCPVPDFGQQKQSTWSELVHKSVFTDLLSVVPARDKLRLKSLDVEGSGLWLSLLFRHSFIPSEALGLAIPSFEFSLLLRWWLGERLLSTPSCPCSWCGSQADSFGDNAVSFGAHAVSCPRSNVVLRHQVAVRGLECMLSIAGITYQREQRVDSSHDRPADLLIRAGPNEELCAVDVSVVHPTIPSAPSAEAESRNRQRYQEQCSLVPRAM